MSTSALPSFLWDAGRQHSLSGQVRAGPPLPAHLLMNPPPACTPRSMAET